MVNKLKIDKSLSAGNDKPDLFGGKKGNRKRLKVRKEGKAAGGRRGRNRFLSWCRRNTQQNACPPTVETNQGEGDYNGDG